jgi:hypothetical protein
MDLSGNAADAIRKFGGIGDYLLARCVTSLNRPAILQIFSAQANQLSPFETYIDIDILVPSSFESKRDELIRSSENLGFVDI